MRKDLLILSNLLCGMFMDSLLDQDVYSHNGLNRVWNCGK